MVTAMLFDRVLKRVKQKQQQKKFELVRVFSFA